MRNAMERTAVILARMFGLDNLSDSNASDTVDDAGMVEVKFQPCDSRCCGCIPCVEYAEHRMAHYAASGDWTMFRAMDAARNANETNIKRRVFYRTR